MSGVLIGPEVPEEFVQALSLPPRVDFERFEDAAQLWAAVAEGSAKVLVSHHQEGLINFSSLQRLAAAQVGTVVIVDGQDVDAYVAMGVRTVTSQVDPLFFREVLNEELARPLASFRPRRAATAVDQGGGGESERPRAKETFAPALKEPSATFASAETSSQEELPEAQENSLPSASAETTELASGFSVAVWGPLGSPGSTTIAINLAAQWAQEGRSVLLIDADTYGASCAAHVGVLDEAASLVQAARRVEQSSADAQTLLSLASRIDISGSSFLLLTGLTSSSRWRELNAPTVLAVIDRVVQAGWIVVTNTGFCLEEGAPSFEQFVQERNDLPRSIVASADHVVAVGTGDAIGLPRLLREIHVPIDLRGTKEGITIVLNKIHRSTSGFDPVRQVLEAWERFGPKLPVAFTFPLDEKVAQAVSQGQCVHEFSKKSEFLHSLRHLGQEILSRSLKR